MSPRSFVRLCFFISCFISMMFLVGTLFELPAYAALSNLKAPSDSNAPFVVSQIHISGAPLKKWCYDVGWAADGRYYLSDDSQGQVDVVIMHPNGVDVVAKPIGRKDFMGPMGCDAGNYSQEGPEGVEESHGQLWTADGNSHVLVFDAQSGRLLHTIDTRGKFRADEMSINPTLGFVAVTNPDETFSKPHHGTPYLSFISTRSYQIVATLPFKYAQAGKSGLQAPLWIGGNELLIDVPAPQGNNGGELDRVTLNDDGHGHYQAQVFQRYVLTNCSPSGLAMDTSTGLIAVGCAGGRQIIWNVRTNRVVASIAIPGADIVASSDHFFFFPSYIKRTLTVTDEQGNIKQIIKTSAQSHTVTADPTTGQVFVPLDGGNVLILQPRYR